MGYSAELQTTLEIIRKKRAYVFSRYLPEPTNQCRAKDIEDVVVVISASRSGSSFLYHLLSGHPDVLSPQGEEITFYKLAGLGLIGELGDSDLIANDILPSPIEREALANDILRDSGCPISATRAQDFPVDRYLVDSVQRLLLQWPDIDFDCDVLYRSARTALDKHLPSGAPFDSRAYWLDLLSDLIARGYPINPYFYDLPRELIQRKHPAISTIASPPFSAICLEEPPFVVPQPKAFPGPGTGTRKCLLLKSSSNCYRVEFMKSLYPNARFSFIYLTRNPAGAINGLMDGWLSNGFFSQRLARLATLNIAGYSSPLKPWSQQWWNFDLPPGWRDYVDQPLENVCAFQWRSANEHVLSGIETGAIDNHIRIRYEDMLDPNSLQKELRRAFEFARLPAEPVLADFKSPAPVMSVNPPGPRKWMLRRDVITPAVKESRVAAVADKLGYDVQHAEDFV